MTKRIRDVQGVLVTLPHGRWRKLRTFTMIPGKIQGARASEVLKKAMKSVRGEHIFLAYFFKKWRIEGMCI